MCQQLQLWCRNKVKLQCVGETSIRMCDRDLNENAAQAVALRPLAQAEAALPDIVIGNIHVLFNQKRGDTKLGQVQWLCLFAWCTVCNASFQNTKYICFKVYPSMHGWSCRRRNLHSSAVCEAEQCVHGRNVLTGVAPLQVRVLAEEVHAAARARPPAANGTMPPAVAAIMGDFNSAAGGGVYRCILWQPSRWFALCTRFLRRWAQLAVGQV